MALGEGFASSLYGYILDSGYFVGDRTGCFFGVALKVAFSVWELVVESEIASKL